MANEAVIIAGALDSKELEKSIDALVSYVDKKIGSMATNFDNELKRMKESLKNLGDIKVDSGGASDAGSSRRTKRNSEEAKSVRETAVAYDQLATAVQNATKPKSAEQSFYAFIQNYREHAAKLANEIKNMPSASLDRQMAEYQRFEKEINAVQRKIQELRQQLNDIGGKPSTSRFEVKAITDEINRLQTLIRQLTSEQISSTRRIAEEDNAAMVQKRALYERTVQLVRELTTEQNSSTVALQRQNAEQEQLTRKIQRQAEIIRQRIQENGKGFATWGTSVIYDPNDSRNIKVKQTQLSIEEQLLQAHQQQVTATQERIALEQREKQAKQEVVADTQQQVQAEKQVTQAQQQRTSVQTKKTFQSYEDFAQALAHVLGLQQQEIRLADSETASYNRLQQTLKTLQSAYNQLSNSERNSDNGKTLVASMHEVQRAIQKIQQQAARPVNLMGAMGLSEKTLDDIAYKMQMLSRYRNGIDLTNPNSRNEIQRVNSELERLKSTQDKLIGQNARYAHSNELLGRSFNYIKNRIAFYFTVGASTSFVKNLIEVRSQYEMNERALGILINSAERGTQIFNELSQMALVSPYTLIELSSAARQLAAYDIAAKDVVNTTRRLADMAAAVGIPIERLTYALGQIKAYGYLNARDARMFANAGIPLVKQLSEYYTELEGRLVSTADIYDKIKKKAIGYNDVMQVITKMTDEGGKFFDFQAKMADTLKVRLANFTLAWNNMLNDIGKSNQGMLVGGINLLTRMLKHWRDLENAMYAIVLAYGAVKAGQILYVAWNQKVSLSTAAADVSSRKFVGALYSMKGAFTSLVTSPMTWWMLLATAATSAAISLYQANEKLKEFNKSIRDGAKENYKNISDFFKQYSDLRESLYKYDEGGRNIIGTNNIDKEQAEKVWEAIREQIELTSATSDEYIKRLLLIENESDRVREGFDVLENIQAVNAALKELGDKEIDLNQDKSGWWNLWTLSDGLIGNIKDYTLAVDNAKNETDSFLNKAAKTYLNYWLSMQPTIKSLYKELFPEQFGDTEKALKRLQDDLKDTTDSINKFINESGWGNAPEKIAETYNQIAQKIANENSLDPNEAFTLQLGIEEAKSQAMMQALKIRINDENAALSVAREENSKKDIQARIDSLNEQLNIFSTTTAASRVYWNDFTKYMKEQHISEVRQMFRGMDDEQIKSINFQDGEYKKFVNRMVQGYADKHKMSYDEAFNYLRSWVRDANQWSIFIKLNIGTGDDKSIYDILNEADSAADTAYKKMQRLQRRQKELQAKGGSLSRDEKVRKESAKITKELTDLQEEYNDALKKGGHSQKEEKQAAKDANKSRREAAKAQREAAKAQREAETELQKALKDELHLIDKVRSQYDKLSKAGYDNTAALDMVTSQFESSISHINSILGKNGLPLFDISKFAGTDNPNAILAMLKSQLDAAKGAKNIKPSEIKDLEVKFSEITVDAEVYNMKKITDGLNNELGKLKDEYELAVELDANPEVGNVFANMMGIDTESLPHTVKEYVDRYATYLNKYLKGKNSSLQFTGDELRGLTRDDITAFKEQVNAGTFNQEWFDAIKKAYDDIQGKRKKDIEDTEKWKNSLIEKYGNLQDKLTKIYKDSVQQQVNAVKSFGTEDQKSDIVRLKLKLEATDDPAELADINLQIAEIVKDVTDKNPIALKVVTSSKNQKEIDTSKAYWDDFKNSDLYTMTFEDMANNSTRAIQLIIEKLNELKDKVKEDPASMKALIKSLNDAESELNARNPLAGIIRSIKEMSAASREAKIAQEELQRAEVGVKGAQTAVDNAKAVGDTEELAKANERLVEAKKKRTSALVKLTQAENKGKKAEKGLKESVQNTVDVFNKISEAVNGAAEVFRIFGDDDTADAISEINKGFSAMTTVIMGVFTALLLLKSTNPWLLAISAALGVIVGLVSFLSGNSNKKITKKVEESERAVKRLELAYIDLEHAVKQAFGMATIGANMAAKANKELQLLELKRQLALERSRDSKHRDEDKIIDLQKQIKELEYDIADTVDNIVNDLLGVSSVGDAMENMMDAFIGALRSGDDAMAKFDENVDEMIANMVKKMYVTKILQPWFEEQWNKIQSQLTERAGNIPEELAKIQSKTSIARSADTTDNNSLIEALRALGMSDEQIHLIQWYDEFGHINRRESNARLKAAYEKMLKEAEQKEAELQKELTAATTPSTDDIRQYAELLRSGQPIMEENMQEVANFLRELGLMKDDANKKLSNLQAGISGITEDTANALEAITNGISQQCYLQSDILIQIRDTIQSFDIDIQTASLSQILLQLQSSYQLQQSMLSTMEGWSNASGNAVKVELIS